MLDIEIVRSNIKSLFDLTGIEQVVCVDDDYEPSVEKIKDLCINLSFDPTKLSTVEYLEGIDFQLDLDDWKLNLIKRLEDLSAEQLQEIYDSLSPHVPEEENYPNKVVYLLRPYGFKGVSPRQWERRQAQFLEEGKDGKTLFLFDQNLGEGREGIQIIKRVISSSSSENIICGLLSNTFSPENEYESWCDFAKEYEIKPHQFLLISKDHKTYESCAGMIKLIVLNRLCETLKTEVSNVLETTQKKAKDEINKIGIYDFEHMVFKTSLEEGVWEPDTLLRLYTIFQRRELLNSSRASTTISNAADRIRQTIGIGIANKAKKTKFALQAMHSERFESENYLNNHHIPLDLGDIFEANLKEEDEVKTAYYLLLAQPCDLTVRRDGTRKSSEGVFLEIQVKGKNIRPEHQNYYDLLYYKLDDSIKYCVVFTNPINVNLSILDLCVFDELGEAKIEPDSEAPSGLIASWNKRFDMIKEMFHHAKVKLEKYDADEEIQELILPSVTLDRKFKASVSSGLFQYDLKRVGRLRQPVAGEILLRFANHNARAAFDHALDREVKK